MTPDDPRLALPRRYIDFGSPEGQRLFRDRQTALAEQQKDDIEFAREHDAIVVEGPWEGAPQQQQQVAYVGIDMDGRRTKLPAICARWRFDPVVTRTSSGTIWRRRTPGEVVAVRVYLGRQLPGMVVGRPQGQVPVQAYGVIDGKDYYFRSRGEHWSMSIGSSIAAPDWYYEEPYGTWPEAGSISEDQAYEFIAVAASKFRAGVPTMTEHRIDRATASIMAAIGTLPPVAKVD
jgi:hypothetical protein